MENKAQREQKRDLKMNRSLMTHSTSNDPIYIEFIELLFLKDGNMRTITSNIKNISKCICIYTKYLKV